MGLKAKYLPNKSDIISYSPVKNVGKKKRDGYAIKQNKSQETKKHTPIPQSPSPPVPPVSQPGSHPLEQKGYKKKLRLERKTPTKEESTEHVLLTVIRR